MEETSAWTSLGGLTSVDGDKSRVRGLRGGISLGCEKGASSTSPAGVSMPLDHNIDCSTWSYLLELS